MLEVHRDVALSNSPQEHVHKQSISLASIPILEYPCHKEWWEYQLVVSIFGDQAIWNWRTGIY